MSITGSYDNDGAGPGEAGVNRGELGVGGGHGGSGSGNDWLGQQLINLGMSPDAAMANNRKSATIGRVLGAVINQLTRESGKGGPHHTGTTGRIIQDVIYGRPRPGFGNEPYPHNPGNPYHPLPSPGGTNRRLTPAQQRQAARQAAQARQRMAKQGAPLRKLVGQYQKADKGNRRMIQQAILGGHTNDKAVPAWQRQLMNQVALRARRRERIAQQQHRAATRGTPAHALARHKAPVRRAPPRRGRR